VKRKVLWILAITVVLLCGWYLQGFRYYGSSSDKKLIEQSFRNLADAWRKNDTNAVRSLCVSEFDPYSDSEIVQFAFQMEHRSSTRKQVLQLIEGGDYAYQPDARRDWTVPFSHYFVGKVYYYRKDNDQWKFTGGTDYYVE
jgi:hypothetical protein